MFFICNDVVPAETDDDLNSKISICQLRVTPTLNCDQILIYLKRSIRWLFKNNICYTWEMKGNFVYNFLDKNYDFHGFHTKISCDKVVVNAISITRNENKFSETRKSYLRMNGKYQPNSLQ